MVRPNGILQPEWKRQALFEIDLLAVDRLLVSGPAAPGAVLSHLAGSGELMVGMRDLTNVDAADATPLTIVAVQLRRMVTGFPSSASTHFITLAAMQAFRGGRVDEGAQALLHLIENPGFARELHLAVSSTTATDGGLAAKIRIVDGRGESGRRYNEAGSFVLNISPSMVTISSINWDDSQSRSVTESSMSKPVMEKIELQELETDGGTVVITEIRLDGENVEVIKGRYKQATPSDFDIWWDESGIAKHEPHKWNLNRLDEKTERIIRYVEKRRREYMLTGGHRRK